MADSALTVKKSGRAASSDLQMKSSSVPTFRVYQKKVVKGKVEVFKVKSIPRLDIGAEREVSASDLSPLKLPATRELNLKGTRRNHSPELLQRSRWWH